MNDARRAGVSRILIVKLSSLGDILHALPAVHHLRLATGAQIDWVVQSEYAELVRGFTDVARVITTSRRAFVRQLPGLLRELRRERYDLIVDLQGLLKSAVVARLARGGKRIGPSFQREGARLFYDAVAGPRDLKRHAVEQNLDVVRYLGLPLLAPEFSVKFPSVTLAGGGRHVGLLPVSRWESKNWPTEHFAALAKGLLEADPGLMLYLLGGKEDGVVCGKIATGLPPARVKNLAGSLSLPELGGTLKALHLLIANDSGPVHIAAAVGTPTLVLFGPTEALRTGPFGAGHRVLRAPLPCAPCYDRACRRHGEPCLAKLGPGVVLGVAREMLMRPGIIA